MTKRDEVREDILRIIHTNTNPVCDDKGQAIMSGLEIVDQILALDNLAIVNREAKLPASPHMEYTLYQLAQEDMQADGWVKEVPR